MRPWIPALGLSLLLAAGCGGGPFDDYVIHTVELNQAPKLEFLQARVGMKFLEVRFDFDNQSGDPVTLRALDFSLRDTAGTLHPFSAQVLDMGQPAGYAHVDLQPGMKQTGSVVFQIPERSDPAQLIFRYDTDGGKIVSLSASD
ncbi:MAG: DUF4352 domain-containing protein [Candidatus Polarisedimenticolia bacterium]